MKNTKGAEHLIGFKFYEINDPYYALIKAKDDTEAVQLYIDVVAGEDNEREEIKKVLQEIELITALGTYVQSFYHPVITIEETFEEYAEFLLKEESNVLLIDGSVL